MLSGKVSIIVISYNQAKYIRECLNSIKAQSYTNWELFAVDDFSQDHSTEVYNEWLDENGVVARKIYHEKNIGLCKTLNEVVPLCTGYYIKLIAADDFLHPDLIRESVERFEREDDFYGLTYSNAEYVDNASVSLHKSVIPGNSSFEGNIFEKLLSANFIPALTVMLKAEVFKTLGLFDESIWIEDWEYWLRVSQKYKCAYIPKVLAYYRTHEANISHTNNSVKLIKGEWQILLKYEADGLYRRVLDLFIRGLYFRSDQKELILTLYSSYKYKNKVLFFMLKHHWPKSVIRVVHKLFPN